MQLTKEQIHTELAKYGQEHLLQFYDQLSPELQAELLQDIASINLDEVCQAFKKSNPRNNDQQESIDSLLQPLGDDLHQRLESTNKDALDALRSKGLNEIAQGKVAALLLAGGQGTRLGSDKPKGMFDLRLLSGKTLYQIQAERIRKLEMMASALKGDRVHLPWYIMTSGHTIEPTVEFFKENNYFGLSKENVIIFEQNTLPCFTLDGKIILDAPHKIARAPDGNGGLYKALRGHAIYADMTKRGIEHIHVYSVDNILVKVADPVFIGYCLQKNVQCAAKVVEKRQYNEAVGIICKVNDKFKVVEYSEITLETAEKKTPQGSLVFRAGNICNHYFSLDFLVNQVKEDQLIHHVAKKKIPYINASGDLISPTKPNGIKLEKFVFDVFEFAKTFAVLEVCREDEFAPMKNNDNSKQDTPTTARLSLYNLHWRYVLNAGGKFVDDDGNNVPLIPSPAIGGLPSEEPDTNNNHVDSQVLCEISPLTSYDGEGLQALNGKKFKSPLQL